MKAQKVLIIAGKGGVGKTTLAVNMAVLWAREGWAVGLLDADIHSPAIPRMLGIHPQGISGLVEGIEPASPMKGLKVVSMALYLHNEATPIAWRGPIKQGVIKQFISESHWGNLDFLIVDLGMSPFGPLVAGSSFAAYVTVRNDGTAAGNAGYLDVWANQPAEVTNKLQGNKYVSAGALGVGQSRTLTLSGLSAPASNGPCTLRACADSRWQAAEQSETNNQATLNYTVRSVTNLVLNGAPAVWESSGTQYGCTAFYSDGLSEDVTTRAAWSDSSSYAGIYGGYLTTKAVSANQMCTVTAAFGGRKVSAAVAILNVP